MATTFTDCPPEVSRLATELMRRHHPDLLAAGVTIKFMFAANEKGPALKHKGWPATAIVKINSLKHRCEGLTDATIHIDEEWWEEHIGENERRALLDHELL